MIQLTRVDICYKIEHYGRVFFPERSEAIRVRAEADEDDEDEELGLFFHRN